MRHRSTNLICIQGLAAVALALAPAAAVAQPAPELPVLRRAAAAVSVAELHTTIERLVGFGTRHTLSDTTSPSRGIGAARTWVRGQFEGFAQACGGCLTIATPSETVTGERIPRPTEVMDVLAIQRGTDEPDRVVVISAHLDSRVRDVQDATSDAPGANDDGSGVAAVLEAARILSQHRFRATIVYAVLSGEEQGLYGGRVLANYAQAQHWRVEADLNNDIIGNTHGADGSRDATHIRVFSEGTRSRETPAEADRRRYNGGELDSPSRNLARFIDGLADRYLSGVDVTMVYRTDRYSRGGDQVRMLEAGFPAVRITEAREDYDREHQDVRVENGRHYGDTLDGIDFPYLAQVTRLNVVTLAALAAAPAPPSGVQTSGAVTYDTTVSWTASPGATGYRVWWRATTEPQWTMSRPADASGRLVLRSVNIDDFFFGVQAVGADGAASPIVFPGAAGAFFPEPAAAPSP
jgi:Zn-dependent M28 family amino/carboxypeptidase